MEELTKEEQERLGLYTHRFKALWDNYFWAKEQIEHRNSWDHILSCGCS